MMLLIHWCGGAWILEQPASSLMQEHPAVCRRLAEMPILQDQCLPWGIPPLELEVVLILFE